MRSVITAAVLALATLVAVPALADSGEGRGKQSFPMPAAAFKQKVDTRMAKARERMEARASKLSTEEAKQLRAKFDAAVAKVNAEVAKATADGTVTKEEAKAVRQASPHKGKHGKHARAGKSGHRAPKK
ncbi:MAG: hypothetical protein KF819_23490 [Labilithrix sp.]|nr:hypothetical protein [Labilithrix sp.]